ncbi:MAG: C40 family peptidase [Verrucomicrobia bacterium]|nr:C40 family peptidase [Verrucomicrobiota bacterium]
MLRPSLLCLLLAAAALALPEPTLAQNAIERFFGAKPTPKPRKKKSASKSSSRSGSKATGKSKARLTPTPTPTPEPTATPTPTPTEVPTPTPTPEPSPEPTKAGKAGKGARKGSPTPTPTPKPGKGARLTPTPTPSPTPRVTPTPTPSGPARGSGITSSITPSELREFNAQPERIQRLIRRALELTERGLTYTYGSADPAKGGMDCSGTIYFLLREQGLSDVPRQANEQYIWVRKKRFYAVLSRRDDTFELADLQPGDLMFWTGTYGVDRDPPVTHTMLYLGTLKNGKRVMFGASNGRTYNGAKQNGVSVFDFKVPSARQRTEAAPDNAPDFSGYGPIPGTR